MIDPKQILKYLVALSVVISVFGCSSRSSRKDIQGKELYSAKYAKGFSLHSCGKSSIINIFNPWQGARDVEYSLFISRDGELPPQGFEGTVVSSPIERVVCMSSSHVAFMDALGLVDRVVGVSGAGYLTGENICKRRSEGKVSDVGYDNLINYEVIAGLRPSLVLIYGVGSENSSVTNKLRELSIPYMYVGDYLENSPLGKSEWIVAFGEIFSCRERAEEIFAEIVNNYNTTKKIVGETGQRPVVMLNAPWKDKWFVPGDRSYMVELIHDAGGEYVFAGDDSERSRPISIETAYVSAMKSDVWLCPNDASSLEEVIRMGSRFAEVPAIKNHKVFNNTARGNAQGGSDFWESGAVRPDLILNDMAAILHPGCFPEWTMFYFKRLE